MIKKNAEGPYRMISYQIASLTETVFWETMTSIMTKKRSDNKKKVKSVIEENDAKNEDESKEENPELSFVPLDHTCLSCGEKVYKSSVWDLRDKLLKGQYDISKSNYQLL